MTNTSARYREAAIDAPGEDPSGGRLRNTTGFGIDPDSRAVRKLTGNSMQGENEERLVELFGVRFNDLTLDELCQRIERYARGGAPTYIVTANVDHVCRCHSDPMFRDAYANAGTVVCDGKPLIWMSKVLGSPLREKLSGSDLVVDLSEYAAEKGLSVYLFGAAEGVAAQAAKRLQERFPRLKVSGVASPPMAFYSDEIKSAEAVRTIAAARPDICFVALGSPQQEIWMAKVHRECNAAVMIGIGASFDFLAGRVKRAPRWMQHAGLEWIWRLYQEPRRLWRRYLVDDMKILSLFWRELWRYRSRQTRTT
ncbi:MAG: WecB/TagA/CpsF family glycosyltransferase [Candidatus Hydrogenedentes bacterium]|nr:WecB/TagA/CpsF family glycosyltransferase [Candidatus Hydrogenedentota bacterium]